MAAPPLPERSHGVRIPPDGGKHWACDRRSGRTRIAHVLIGGVPYCAECGREVRLRWVDGFNSHKRPVRFLRRTHCRMWGTYGGC